MVRKSVWVVALLVLAFLAGFGGSAPKHAKSIVYDVSWPNCSANLHAERGIVGINGGLDFRPNPCLATEAGWFKNAGVYVNTGYPGDSYGRRHKNFPEQCGYSESRCLAYNWGFNAGRYDIKYASLQGVVAQRWWLDVETINSWTDKPSVNRQALAGMVDALSLYAGRGNLGYYSTPNQWNKLTGKWHNHFPIWIATGANSQKEATAACHQRAARFTAGKVYLAQYTPNLDENIICRLRVSGGAGI